MQKLTHMTRLTDYHRYSLGVALKVVSDYFDTSEIEILRPTRKDEVCYRRYLVFYFAYEHFKVPIGVIRYYCGFKQHGTVINGLNKISGWASVSKPVTRDLEQITNRLQSFETRNSIEQSLSLKPP